MLTQRHLTPADLGPDGRVLIYARSATNIGGCRDQVQDCLRYLDQHGIDRERAVSFMEQASGKAKQLEQFAALLGSATSKDVVVMTSYCRLGRETWKAFRRHAELLNQVKAVVTIRD